MTPNSRQRILEATWQQLREHGLVATNMDRLAAQLGMSKKTLYKHFASKQELVAAAFHARGDVCRQRLQQLLSHPDLGQPAWLEAVRQFYAEVSSEVSLSLGQELLRWAPELWLHKELFLRTAVQLVLDSLVCTARVPTSNASGRLDKQCCSGGNRLPGTLPAGVDSL